MSSGSCIIMNLTRCIFRETIISHFTFKSNLKHFERTHFNLSKNIFLSFHKTYSNSSGIVPEASNYAKKRLAKKKKVLPCEGDDFRVTAFSTAEEYNLESLSLALTTMTAFKPSSFSSDFGSSVDVVHAVHNQTNSVDCNQVGEDLFFFRDGCIVMWNIPDVEIKKILDFLKHYEGNSFREDLVKNESEVITCSFSEEVSKTQILQGNLILSNRGNILLEKYAVSNAMALSVNLGTYEANLEKYIETMGPVTEDLKSGNKIKMTRSEVLQKTGQLFALRHNINLKCDLLDTPDFYWDRDELENLYQSTFNYFCISKRTRVINEKINHCIELVELLSSHLSDKHHVRLEWMIIILIMVEVAFEICHYMDRYLESHEK